MVKKRGAIAAIALAATGCNQVAGIDKDFHGCVDGPDGDLCRTVQLFEAPEGDAKPFGIAVDDTYVYWTLTVDGVAWGCQPQATASQVMRAKKSDGSGATSILDANSAAYVAADDTHVYVTEFVVNGGIARIPRDGGAADLSIVDQACPNAITAHAGSVVWANYGGDASVGSIMHAPASGGSATEIAGNRLSPFGIVVSGNSAYWQDQPGMAGTEQLRRAPLTGGTVDSGFATVASCAGELAADDRYIYFGSKPKPGDCGGNDYVVSRIPLAGGEPEPLATGQSEPAHLAVDKAFVYWTNTGNGTVMKVPLEGGDPVVLAMEQDTPFDIAVDDNYVYWTNRSSSHGAVMRVQK
ncbi:Putative serine/threonine-protein kinase pknH [Minicystis rosea]|nr:Putative serine/threonine-protein kinase pknH [Minicystis rosea]